MIRDLYPSDFLYLLFHREPALSNEAGSCIFWDEEKASRTAYAPFLRQWLVPNERRFTWVCKDGNLIQALISAKERASPLSWEIDYFLLPQKGAKNLQFTDDISRGLLETVAIHAGMRGVRKVFFRSFSSNPFLDVMRSSNFKAYLNEYLFRAERLKLKTERHRSSEPSGEEGWIFRPRHPADDDALYRLLFNMQPAAIKNVECMNMREWLETREKSCFGEREMVLEKGNSIAGWLSMKYGADWGHFRVKAYAGEKDNLERIFLIAVNFLRNKKYVYCTVRDYQEELKGLVAEKGFEKKEEFALFYKEISITEKKPMLVSQQV